MNELEDVLHKYFSDSKVKYYTPADAIANEQYIRWSYFKNERKRILISIGSSDGEVDVKLFEDAKAISDFIKLIIF